MFGSNKKAPDERREGANVLNLIGQGTKISGNITSQGDVRIDGELVGNIVAHAKIVIGPTGSIFGDIVCENADISGKVEGTIRVKDLLQLKAAAGITGDIETNKMVVEPGAVFNGRCNMSNAGTFTFELPLAEKGSTQHPTRAANVAKTVKAE